MNYGVNWVHTFSPTLILQASFGHANVQDNGDYEVQRRGTRHRLFSPSFAGDFIGGATVTPGLERERLLERRRKQRLEPELRGHLRMDRQRLEDHRKPHLKFGGSWASSNFESLYNNANSTYSTAQTGNPQNSAEPGSALASYFLNVPDNAGRRNVHETTRYGGVMGFYFQDQWKATSKLTVNIGLRYDLTIQPPYGKWDTVGQNGGIETGSINFNNGTYIVQVVPPACKDVTDAPCIPGDGTLPANVVASPDQQDLPQHDQQLGPPPRLRVPAWRQDRYPFGLRDDLRQLGRNHPIGAELRRRLARHRPAVGQQPERADGVESRRLRSSGQNPFAPTPLPPGTPNCYCNASNSLYPAPTPFNQVQWFMDPYAKNPYSMQWNFGIQHQFTETQVVSANYVGSGSRRTNVGGYYNTALTPGPGDPQARALYPNISSDLLRSFDREIQL